jgi:uncharacterized protein (UPF0332 family)
MNAREFLELAEELLAGPSEVYWRTAVSRAYFFAFHVARSLMEKAGFEVPESDAAHAYLSMRLSNAKHPEIQEAGRGLEDSRRARNRADYRIELPFDEAKANADVLRASAVAGLLEEAAALPTVVERITEVMRIYERDVLRDVTWRAPGSS